MKSIAADTSFYSCFYCHIEDLNCLIHLMRCYSFYIGINIFNEIPNDLKDNPIFITKIKEEEYDYVALMQPLLERDPKHLYDGEYEAIGLAYYLDTLNKLNYLIIDDRKPYNFVKRHFKHLKKYLTGTIGFIEQCTCIDENITSMKALSLLNNIKDIAKDSNNIRPCSMDKKNHEKIINPVIERIRRWNSGKL